MSKIKIGMLLIPLILALGSTAHAAAVKINKDQWDAVSPADKQKITAGLRRSGILKRNDYIIGSPNVGVYSRSIFMPLGDLEPLAGVFSGACRIGCDGIAAGALVWCGANTAGAGLIACIAGAEAGRELCKSQC